MAFAGRRGFMAPLQNSPGESATYTPPLPASSDAEAANHQLLSESRSAAANPAPPPAAVLGVNLLNAARIGPNSAAGSMARKNGAGKLKRVSMVAEGPKQNLARRGDVYEIQLSPEKGAYALPEKVNRKPLKVMKKKRKRNGDFGGQRSDALGISSGLPVHHAIRVPSAQGDFLGNPVPTDPSIPSSPHEAALAGSYAIMVDGAGKDAPAIEAEPESNHGDHRPCKVQRAEKQNPSRPERSKKTKSQARDAPEASSRHTSDSEREGDSDIDPATKISKPPRKPNDNSVVSSKQLPTRTHRSRPHSDQPETNPVPPELASVDEDFDSDFEPEAGEGEPEISQDNESEHTAPGNLDRVFRFLDLEERFGRCQVKFATTIRRMCDKSYSHLQDESISMNTVIEHATDIQEMLERVDSKIRHKDRSAFKSDAYGHVFRSLTFYLEGLYSWLLQTHQTVGKSLDATRVMTRLIHAILAFKDTIASWDVSIPQSYKGGRVIKDVDIRLIAPLRQVYKIFTVHLRKLEDTEQLRVQYAETKRKMQKQRDAERMRIETIETSNKRKKRWQDLHIVRMQCEPDKYRRYKLYTTRIEDLEERDANGMVFERLPIFKPRSTQPQSQVAEPADVLEWTDEEEIALLGGLEQCTGPRVLERIFKTYCDPDAAHPDRGLLRNRSVTDIVLKARSFRLQLLAQYQNEGWPIPNWITNIPVLP